MSKKTWLYITSIVVVSLACVNDETAKCRYVLNIPPDLDVPGTPHFDTTIVRSATCSKHLLRLPPQGTETRYIIRMDTFERDLHFGFDEDDKQWLDIGQMPAGEYHVRLLACGNGGTFTLRLR